MPSPGKRARLGKAALQTAPWRGRHPARQQPESSCGLGSWPRRPRSPKERDVAVTAEPHLSPIPGPGPAPCTLGPSALSL